MTVKLYKSTDASAPTLSGTVGSLTTLLDAVLIDGYGSQTAAGWTIAYTATNVRAYKQGAGSNGFYLRVNDSGARVGTVDEALGTANVNEARVRGYEIMTGLTDSGLNLFPTLAARGGGNYVRKSATANGTARTWIIVADQRTFYMFLASGDVANVYTGLFFGELYSLRANDPGRCFLVSRPGENSAAMSQAGGSEYTDTMMNDGTSTNQTHFLARNAQGAPGSIAFTCAGDLSLTGYSGSVLSSVGTLAYKNPADGTIYISPMWMYQSSGGMGIRGKMRGLWHWCHTAASCSDGDTITGSGDLTGRTFLIIKGGANGGVFCVETSDTWDTN